MLSLLVILIFLVGCTTEEVSDEELESLSDEELKIIVAEGEQDSGVNEAIAGQAYIYQSVQNPSKRKVSRAASILKTRLNEQTQKQINVAQPFNSEIKELCPLSCSNEDKTYLLFRSGQLFKKITPRCTTQGLLWYRCINGKSTQTVLEDCPGSDCDSVTKKCKNENNFDEELPAGSASTGSVSTESSPTESASTSSVSTTPTDSPSVINVDGIISQTLELAEDGDVVCIDEDGLGLDGLNPKVKGRTYYYIKGVEEQPEPIGYYRIREDYCYDGIHNVVPVEEGPALAEFICLYGEKVYPNYDSPCPNGCKNGVCV